MVTGEPMPATAPTFVFDDDGKAYAYVAGKIVAAADDADDLERQLTELDTKQQVEAPEAEVQEEAEASPQESFEASMARATHVRTPNGLKGTILGKQRGLWGDQVTIRLENGRIAKFDVTPDSKVEFIREGEGEFGKTAHTDTPFPTKHNYVAKLQEKLAETPDGTKASLRDRITDLKVLKKNARTAITDLDYVDQQTVDNIIVQADYELREVTDALAALDDAEAYAPPAPFSVGIAEQESLGGNDSSWLDQTVGDMIAENEAQDFDTLMDEGPELFVAELETPTLEDSQTVQEQADQFVSARTAGLDPSAVADFRKTFLARVEGVRELELDQRTAKREAQVKEASTENFDGPAEGLFF